MLPSFLELAPVGRRGKWTSLSLCTGVRTTSCYLRLRQLSGCRGKFEASRLPRLVRSFGAAVFLSGIARAARTSLNRGAGNTSADSMALRGRRDALRDSRHGRRRYLRPVGQTFVTSVTILALCSGLNPD